jgi:uncharacterized protein (DUF4415 family)
MASREQRKELAELAALPDAKIDLSDIPEIHSWRRAVVSRFYKPRKESLTIRLDADVLAWLRAEGPGYQTRVNSLLRAAMEKQQVRNHGKLPAPFVNERAEKRSGPRKDATGRESRKFTKRLSRRRS